MTCCLKTSFRNIVWKISSLTPIDTPKNANWWIWSLPAPTLDLCLGKAVNMIQTVTQTDAQQRHKNIQMEKVKLNKVTLDPSA